MKKIPCKIKNFYLAILKLRCFLPLLLLIQIAGYTDYYSQSGQDKFVNEHFFKNAKSKVFIDIGAHKGKKISNTYFFEKELNWKGICIEPIPELFEELKINRNCICIQGCISDKKGVFQFIKFPEGREWFSGLENKYNPSQLKLLQNVYGFTEYELLEVNCFLLNDILEEYGIDHINYLSIDTEGGEFDIIRAIDFSKYTIDVISVEDNFNDRKFKQFLEKKGFGFVKKLDQDLIFVNKNFKN